MKRKKLQESIDPLGASVEASSEAKLLHEMFYAQFEDYFLDLLTARIPAPEISDRGRLNPRQLWRNETDGIVFNNSFPLPSSDTALVMLVDASSSMNSKGTDFGASNFDVCLAITSAFARANKEVCDNAVRMEVFLKTSTAGLDASDFLGEEPCFLTRVYTSTKDMDYRKMMGFRTSNPFTSSASTRFTRGSSTPEYAVLPALYQWAEDSVTEPNKVLVNLTDGEPQYLTLRVGDLQELRYKYLKDWQETTILLGNESWSDPKSYSDNPILANNTHFAGELFGTLSTLMEDNL